MQPNTIHNLGTGSGEVQGIGTNCAPQAQGV